MNKNLMLIAGLLLVFPLLLAACGGDPSAEDVEKAFNKLMEGDAGPMKDITCEEDHDILESAALQWSMMGLVSADETISVECEGKDPIKCRIAGNEDLGLDFLDSESFEVKFEDGKMCGNF